MEMGISGDDIDIDRQGATWRAPLGVVGWQVGSSGGYRHRCETFFRYTWSDERCSGKIALADSRFLCYSSF